MEAFDSTFLTLLFVPSAPCSIDRGRERVDFLIGDIHGRGGQIVIPAPVLSELLIGVGHSRSQILNELTKNPKFIIAPFDIRAAIELAVMTERSTKRSKGNKRGESSSTWAKVKFDRQIVAIAKVYNVTTMYTEDGDVKRIAESEGMTVKTAATLSLPLPIYKGKTLFDNE
jgi:hypothetical protein